MSFSTVTPVFLQSILGQVYPDDPETVQSAFDYIYAKVSEKGLDYHDVTPWDITKLAETDEFAQQVQLNLGQELPVQINVDGKTFDNQYNLSFFLGLGLYKEVVGSDFDMTIYGIDVPESYFNQPAERFEVKGNEDYLELNNGKKYAVPDGGEALDGFTTGAKWYGEDVKDHVHEVRIDGVIYRIGDTSQNDDDDEEQTQQNDEDEE